MSIYVDTFGTGKLEGAAVGAPVGKDEGRGKGKAVGAALGKSVGTAVGAELGGVLIVGAGVGVLPIYPPDTQTAQRGNSEGNGRESEQTRKTRTIIRRRSDALKARARVTIKLP